MRHSPTYQGRPLPRPDEDVVDQGLAFDLGTLMARRQVLRTLGAGAVALGLAACGSSTSRTRPSAASGLGEIPEETAGPFPGDGSNGPDVLSESGVIRRDIRSSFGSMSGTAEGVPLTVELSLIDLATGGAPLAGAAVYLWQADREGRYSLYSDGVTDQNYLRGVQIAGADGVVRFTSIFPACYPGRWPHLHFEVYPDRASITDASTLLSTSQLALPEAACQQVYATSGYAGSVATLSQVSLSSDGVFGEDSGARQLATVTGSAASGLAATLTVGLDTSTAPMSGGFGGAGPGGRPPR